MGAFSAADKDLTWRPLMPVLLVANQQVLRKRGDLSGCLLHLAGTSWNRKGIRSHSMATLRVTKALIAL